MCLQMMQILQKMMSEVILQMRLNLFRQSCSRLTDVCSVQVLHKQDFPNSAPPTKIKTKLAWPQTPPKKAK